MRYLLLSLTLTAGLSFAQTAPEKLVLEDLLDVPALRGSPALSPDGRLFATVQEGQVALLPAAGGTPRKLTSLPGAKSELSWSRDSQKLAFVSEGGIWVVPAKGGEPRRLTDGPAGPGDPRGATDHWPRWNPKGRWILFQSGRRGRNELYVVDEQGGKPVLLAATELYFGRDSLGPTSPDGGDAVSSDRFDPNPSWSPDGTRISYTERSRKYFSGKLKVLAFDHAQGKAKGEALDLYTAANDRGGAWAVNTAAWSPDGRSLAVVLQESGWDKIYLLPAAGGPAKPVTSGDYEDGTPEYSADGKWIAIVSNREAPEERHIWLVRPDGSQSRRLARLGPGVEANPQWSPDGRSIYFTRSSSFEEPALWMAAVDGKSKARPWAPLAPGKFARAGLPAPEAVRFQSTGGLTIAGILYRPAGYQSGRRYPAVISAHGGPEGQETLTFSPWHLYLASQGYVVLGSQFSRQHRLWREVPQPERRRLRRR